MWLIYGVILLGMLVLYMISAGIRIRSDWEPEGVSRIFLKAAILLQGKKQQFYSRTEKLSIFLFCCTAGAVLSLLICGSAYGNSRLDADGRIRRNSYGKGNILLELEARTGDRKEILQVEIAEEQLTEKELEQMLPEAEQILLEKLKAENKSLDQVTKDLNFLTEVEGYPFVIRWESKNHNRIGSDGRVKEDGIPEEGELVELTAEFLYGDFVWAKQFQVRVCRPEYRNEFREELQRAIEIQNKVSAFENEVQLPIQIGQEKITWKERRKDDSSMIFLVFLLTGGIQFYLPDQDVKKKAEERRRQLRLSYPEFINKLTLLMGAGLPVRSALFRMADDYESRKKNGKYNVLYEEIILLCREMSGGITERQAYGNFGERCELAQYRKCAALLRSSQQKGTAGLLEILQEEAENSHQERKHLAREEGERAGTRMLLPMMMMMAVVMLLILVPACFSFTM